MGIEVIEVKEDKTMKELIDELRLSSAPILLEVNRKIYYPDEIGNRRLRKGDKVTFIPLVAGG
ncbi:MoaD/ThiS family protein [Chloroflexota bacterium]